MAAYRWVYDSRHLQADCQELGSAPKPYARQSSMGYLYLFYLAQSVLDKATEVRQRRGAADFERQQSHFVLDPLLNEQSV